MLEGYMKEGLTMMKKTIRTIWQLFFNSVLLTSYLFSQSTWIKTYGGGAAEYPASAIETTDGSYLIVGSTNSYGAGSSDIWLIKTDWNGDTLWTKSYGGPQRDESFSVIETSDQAYLIAGRTQISGTVYFNNWLIKTDTSGDTLWTKTYGDFPSGFIGSPIETSDQAFLIAAIIGSGAWTSNDLWLIKVDLDGNMIWEQTYGGGSGEIPKEVIETSDNAYLIIGETRSIGAGETDAWLIKTDTNGNMIWDKSFGGTQHDYPESVIETSDQHYLIVGHLNSYGAGSGDIWLIKTDVNGDTLWTRTYGGVSWDRGFSVIETSDQDYLIVGQSYSFGSGIGDAWLIKTNVNGDTLWTKTYGGPDVEYAYSVMETTDEGLLICGSTASIGTGDSDIFLIKTDRQGNASWPVAIHREKVQNPLNTMVIAPNPMNNMCRFFYSFNEKTTASIQIYTLQGALVWSYNLGEKEAGTYSHIWNAKNQDGKNLSSGIYILQFATSSLIESQKLILLK